MRPHASRRPAAIVLLGWGPPNRGAHPPAMVHEGGHRGAERETESATRCPSTPSDHEGPPDPGPTPVADGGREPHPRSHGRHVRSGRGSRRAPPARLPVARDGPGTVCEPTRPGRFPTLSADPPGARRLVSTQAETRPRCRPSDCRLRDEPERGKPPPARPPGAADCLGLTREPTRDGTRRLLPRQP